MHTLGIVFKEDGQVIAVDGKNQKSLLISSIDMQGFCFSCSTSFSPNFTIHHPVFSGADFSKGQKTPMIVNLSFHCPD